MIRKELIQYCNDCLADRQVSKYEDYISCEKHKNAVSRLLRDFEREKTEGYPFVFVEDEAQKIVDWFSLLRHSKGVLSGKPIELTICCLLYTSLPFLRNSKKEVFEWEDQRSLLRFKRET